MPFIKYSAFTHSVVCRRVTTLALAYSQGHTHTETGCSTYSHRHKHRHRVYPGGHKACWCFYCRRQVCSCEGERESAALLAAERERKTQAGWSELPLDGRGDHPPNCWLAAQSSCWTRRETGREDELARAFQDSLLRCAALLFPSCCCCVSSCPAFDFSSRQRRRGKVSDSSGHQTSPLQRCSHHLQSWGKQANGEAHRLKVVANCRIKNNNNKQTSLQHEPTMGFQLAILNVGESSCCKGASRRWCLAVSVDPVSGRMLDMDRIDYGITHCAHSLS